MKNYKIKRTWFGRLPTDAYLYESLTKIAIDEDIKLGRIIGIGATSHAVIAYYDQTTKTYNPIELKGGMEILSLIGNISLRDGKPFVHAHIVLGDPQGKAYGGHLMPGTKLFACEIIIEEFEGEQLTRSQDEKTGLFLWKTGNLF